MLGVIVNPVAGMGGAVALRGTDGEAAARARALGAVPVAEVRAARALQRIARSLPSLPVVAAGGEMGGDAARACGWRVEDVWLPRRGATSAADTCAAAQAMAQRGVTLLLFAGGDGTARDVLASVGTDVPVLGVPTGVKMHSGVFGTTPEAAGDVAARYLADPSLPLRDAEVVDVDEAARRRDRLETRLYGVARVPHAPDRLQRAKASPERPDEAILDALCRTVAAEMQRGRTYILGPGTTTRRVLLALGLDGSLTGVNAVLDGELAGSDLTENALLSILSDGRPATLVLGVIGGQGFLLGRGNQQISPAVLRRIGDDVVVLASAEKLATLDPPVLRVDLGNDRPTPALTGYRRVRTGPATSTVLKVLP